MDIQYRADNYKPNNQKLDVEILINQNPKKWNTNTSESWLLKPW